MTAEKLKQLRSQMDQLDQELARSLDRRILLAEEIMTLKTHLGMPILDSEREKSIFQQIERDTQLQNPVSIQRIMKEIIDEGKRLLQDQKPK